MGKFYASKRIEHSSEIQEKHVKGLAVYTPVTEPGEQTIPSHAKRQDEPKTEVTFTRSIENDSYVTPDTTRSKEKYNETPKPAALMLMEYLCTDPGLTKSQFTGIL